MQRVQTCTVTPHLAGVWICRPSKYSNWATHQALLSHTKLANCCVCTARVGREQCDVSRLLPPARGFQVEHWGCQALVSTFTCRVLPDPSLSCFYLLSHLPLTTLMSIVFKLLSSVPNTSTKHLKVWEHMTFRLWDWQSPTIPRGQQESKVWTSKEVVTKLEALPAKMLSAAFSVEWGNGRSRILRKH